MCSQALNQQPVLSGLTRFDKIIVTASSDPLTGSVQYNKFIFCAR